MSSHLKAELAATCSTLGRLHKGKYLIEPHCIESVKDIIRYLKRDNESHDIRRYLGESKILQNDLINIIKSCSSDESDLFDVTLRLLINLTTPTMLFYGEELPVEKVGRNIYLSLIGYNQDYKVAFCDVEFWNKVCGKLTNLFETDWTERSADDGIRIERILMLLRNVLQVPADVENEKRPENDITIHDKVLWALRQSQILELLLFVSANESEEQYYLNLLEIFSLILREQNPKWLAQCDVHRSAVEKTRDTEDLVKAREVEKKNYNKYLNARNFNATYVMKGVKSLSNNDVVCHKSLDKVMDVNVVNLNKKQVKAKRNRRPVESERIERHSTFSVRLFLKEFSLEFLNTGFNHLMTIVKNRLDSGKSLANDQSYYFWALKFFLDFAVASDADINLIKDCLNTEIFHFVQTSMDNAFEHLQSDKKKTVEWVRRMHLILKAYHSLLETLLWLDCSKNPLVRAISRQIKSEIFYVVEYREMTLHMLFRYDPTKFSVSYLRDLIETIHLFIKLLEEFSKQTKLVVQKVQRKKAIKKKKEQQEIVVPETNEEKWDKIKDDVYDTLSSETLFPEIPPFDAASDIPIDDQKGRAMKKIQRFLHEGNIREGIGLLRSAREVWPENDYFGNSEMSVEDETMALQEICLADLQGVESDDKENEEPKPVEEEEEDEENEEEEEEVKIVEKDFDIIEYKKRLVHKKVVEGCGILLKNYQNNSDHTNHCVIKLLHRIGWECCMTAMLYQASLFWTLLKIMKDKKRNYTEINTFTINLIRKFRKHASSNPVVFLELLFWKEHNVALEIQHGYEPYEDKVKPKKKKGRKGKNKENEVMESENVEGEGKPKRRGRRTKEGEKTSRKSRKKKIENEIVITQLEKQEGEDNCSDADTEESEDEFDKLKRLMQQNDKTLGEEVPKKKQNKIRKRKIEVPDVLLSNSESESDLEESKSGFESEEAKYSEDENETDEVVKSKTDEELRDSGDKLIETQKQNSKLMDGSDEDEDSLKNFQKSSLKKSNVMELEDEAIVIKNKMNRMLYSSDEDEENVGESKEETIKYRMKNLGSSYNESSVKGSLEDGSVKKRNRRNNTLDSSDEEEDSLKNSQKSKQSKINESLEQNKALLYSSDEEVVSKDSQKQTKVFEELSDNSQKSESFSKKRVWKENFLSEDSDDSSKSKTKKLKYVGSDSDADKYKSDEEVVVGIKRKKKKLAVIDSESEEDNNSLADK